MGEVRFYHLTQIPLERALPTMLERTLERGGRARVRGVNPDRISFLNTHLWSYADDSFLPHGTDDAPDASQQPVLIGTGTGCENGATTLFLIDGAEASSDELRAMEVTVILFDGHDPAAVEFARGQWRDSTKDGLAAVYWAQSDGGGWIKKAESKTP